MTLYLSHHHGRGRLALDASRQLASVVDELGGQIEALKLVDWDTPKSVIDAGSAAQAERDRLVAMAVTNAAIALEGAFHNLAIQWLGTDYANVLVRLQAAWRWRMLIRLRHQRDTSLDELPLSLVTKLYEARNWVMHPRVINLSEKCTWQEVTVDGDTQFYPVDIFSVMESADAKEMNAVRAAMSVEQTFDSLVAMIDALERSGLSAELFGPNGRGEPAA